MAKGKKRATKKSCIEMDGIKKRATKKLKIEEDEMFKVDEMIEETVDATISRKTFRPSMRPLLQLLSQLMIDQTAWKMHEEDLKKTDFWSLINVLISKFEDGKIVLAEFNKSPHALEAIINSFGAIDDLSCGFKIGGLIVKPHPNSVAVIFGMKRRWMTSWVKQKYGPKNDPSLKNSEFYKTYFQNSKGDRIYKSDILKGINSVFGEKEKRKEFMQLVVLYILCTIFFTNCSGDYINYKYLNCVDSIDAMNSVSWPDLVYDNIAESLNEQCNNAYAVNGCTLYLLYLIFEHMGELREKINSDETPSTSNEIPRFARWNLYEVSSDLNALLQKDDQVFSFIDFDATWTAKEKELCLFDTNDPIKVELENKIAAQEGLIFELENKVATQEGIILDLNFQIKALQSSAHTLQIPNCMLNDTREIDQSKADVAPENTIVAEEKDYQTHESYKMSKASGSGSNNKEDIGVSLHRKSSNAIRYLKTRWRGSKKNIKKEKLKELIDYTQCGSLSTPVWKYEKGASKIFIRGEHIKQLLTPKAHISNEILEFQMVMWAEMFETKSSEQFSPTKFLSLSAWFNVAKKHEAMEKMLINDVLLDVDPKKLKHLLIPMNNSKDPSKPEVGHHFTLLHYDFEGHSWRHYNSLLADDNDQYLENARLMADRVNKALFGDQKHNEVSVGDIKIIPCPQQGEEPNCAMYVLYFMELVMREGDVAEFDRNAETITSIKRFALACDIVSDVRSCWRNDN